MVTNMTLTPTSLDASQLSAVSRLFSTSVVKELAGKGKSPLFSRLVKESSITSIVSPTETVRNFFDVAFMLLKKKNHRHEYIYKTAIAHKILFGIHSLRTAAMLSEFRVGSCKADVVILNGTSTVYEIKSERDNLDRLQNQIETYRKAFAKVNVITGEKHLKSVNQCVPSDVGLLLLTDRYQISTVRESINDPSRVSPDVIFDSLQLSEAIRILESFDVSIPKLPNTQMCNAIRKQFIKLEPDQAHAGMVQVLKESRSLLPLSNLIEALPASLQTAAFSTKIRLKDHAKLVSAMDTPLCDALNWK